MKRISALLLFSVALFAHPMGNFSVNHYTRLEVTARGVQLRYVLDLAEIPTFELLRNWQMDRSAPQAQLDIHGTEQAREWLKHLRIFVDGRPVQAQLESVRTTIADGAGNLPILRVDMSADVAGVPGGGKLELEDQNFPDRAGWKEIVIDSTTGVSLVRASQPGKDLSKALTSYPPDPTVAPPQDLRAELQWRVEKPAVLASSSKSHAALSAETGPRAVISPIAQPKPAGKASSPALQTAQAAPPGSIVRGDYLSQVLHRRKLTLPVLLLAILAAFGLGAAHALTPGHGKTIVAAYLVGSRGTFRHAAFLGIIVTFTHTVAVFVLGLATLFLFRYIVPEKITLILGAVSGLSIVAVGAWMLRKRLKHSGHFHSHSHVHHHHHSHSHNHSHDHGSTGHEHTHDHDSHSHHHGGHTHSHIPDEISWGGLVALGAGGGLVPCESGLILLLGAIALGRVGLGLILLVAFSLGLAIVLMTIGILVLYARNLLPERTRSSGFRFFRLISIASPALVMIVGLVMTGISLGWIQPKWMIG
ncbi:MAG: hypothetical protein JO270_25425 [Acidobacteriaceae bacterium]|nr:hypothetical protein [Acidobacteriaceae bacterium]